MTNFPENFNMVYDTVELTEFDMFKEEIPKLRAIAEACNLENIKMSHRLMEGDLIANIKKIVDTDKIDYVVMGTSVCNRWDAFVGSNSGDVIGIWLLYAYPGKLNIKPLKRLGLRLVIEPKIR
jgi:hypothetical protein